MRPEQVTDVLALVGDTSDNVAGVPGIGKKGAIDLVTQFGSLDAMLERLDELKPKQREALSTHRADALRSRELVTIRTDVPLDVDLESLRYTADRGNGATSYSRTSTSGRSSTTTRRRRRPRTRSSKDYALVDLGAGARRARSPSCARPASSRFESFLTSRRRCSRAIVGIAFSTRDREARYVPLGHVNSDTTGDLLTSAAAPTQVDAAAALDRLRPLFEDDAIRKIGHDLKFDTIVLARHGDLAPRRLAFDSMLASYLLDATRPVIRSRTRRSSTSDYKALTDEDVCGRGAKAVPFAHLPPAALLDYAGERADLARQLSSRLAPLLVTDELEPVYRELEMPLIPVLADIERAGIRHRRAGARRAVAATRTGARRATRRGSSSWPAKSSTSTHRSSSAASCSRSCS